MCDDGLSGRGQRLKTDTTTRQRLGTMLFYGIVIALAYLTFLVVEPFLVALAWASVLVVIGYPVYERLEPRWGGTRAALATTAGVTLVLIVPALAVMYAFVQQGIAAVHSLQIGVANGHFDWVNRFWIDLQHRFPEIGSDNLGDTLRGYAEVVARYAAARMGTILGHLVTFFLHLGVTILAMFYLFRDGDTVLERLRKVLPFEPEYSERMLHEARELIFASVVSSAAGAVADGALGGIAFAATGISAPFFWGVMMAFFSLIPVVGTALIWVPAALSLMLGGHVTAGILLIVFCIVILTCVDNLLRPWLISGRVEMGGLVVFISVLGGVEAFGMLGIVLGPIIVATLASLLDLYSPETRGGNKRSKARGKQLDGVLE
jgi:predicted PurR-regulated permease PerM